MAKRIYTIVYQITGRKSVDVSVPLLPGFGFRAATFIAAINQSQKRIEKYLVELANSGKFIPPEPKTFGVESMLIEVNIPTK